jgi:hypothetical protein
MLVRSHVMSTFYRKKSFPHSHEETPPRDVELGGHSSKFRFESYPQRRNTRRRREKGGNAGEKLKIENSEPTMSIPLNILGTGLLANFQWRHCHGITTCNTSSNTVGFPSCSKISERYIP